MASFRQLRDMWDRVAAVVLTLIGGLLLILGWFGVSGQGLASEQIPYVVSGGLGGIFLMGVGAALWLSADLRDEWMKLDRIEKVLESGLEQLGLGRGADGRPTLVASEQLKALMVNGSGEQDLRPSSDIADPDLKDLQESVTLEPTGGFGFGTPTTKQVVEGAGHVDRGERGEVSRRGARPANEAHL